MCPSCHLTQGRGVLLLSDFESGTFLRQLRDVDVKAAPPVAPAVAASIQPAVQKALEVWHPAGPGAGVAICCFQPQAAAHAGSDAAMYRHTNLAPKIRVTVHPPPGPQNVAEDTKAAAYRTWLGFYKGFAGKLGWSPEELVQCANFFSQTIGELS